MKFVYQYRTPDNKSHEGVISGSSREAVFAALKARGIRPSRVEEAPGICNKLLGRSKRWMLIGFLVAVVAVLAATVVRTKRDVSRLAADALCEERAQIYGSPVVLQDVGRDDWISVFSDCGDRWLARHAIPAHVCRCDEATLTSTDIAEALMRGRDRVLEPVEGDFDEVAKMKRQVNGMKRELQEYLSAGGTVLQYMRRVEIRQRAERSIYERAASSLRHSNDHNVWMDMNRKLRAMGLPMVEPAQPK